MTTPVAPSDNPTSSPPPRVRLLRLRTGMVSLSGLLSVYLFTAYYAAPATWRHSRQALPFTEELPRITHTKDRIPGDPVNLSLVGSEADVIRALVAAGWKPADPITLRTSLRICSASVLRRPYEQAPVSNLYLFGRKQDLAFQQAVGKDPSRRHHVRFWQAPQPDAAGRPVWMGAGTYDSRVGFSHTTGQVTHHIDREVDKERDKILADLRKAGVLENWHLVDSFHQRLHGRNGGGDPYMTDGRLGMGVIATIAAVVASEH